MIDRRASTTPADDPEREGEIVHSILRLICSDVYDCADLSQLVRNDRALATLSAEIAARRLRGVEAFDHLEAAARVLRLEGLIVGHDEDSDPIHVQRCRPYLFVPVRTLAALQTLIEIWEEEGKRFWGSGLLFGVRHLLRMAIDERADPSPASRVAWEATHYGRHISVSTWVMFTHLADRFVEEIGAGLLVPRETIEERLWFLDADDIDHVSHNLDHMRRRIMELVPFV